MIQTLSALLLIYLCWIACRWAVAEIRRLRLIRKYTDDDIADRIMLRCVWLGQTEQQLFDSLGKPLRVVCVNAGSGHMIYSYDELGTGRYRMNVRLVNRRVVSCEHHGSAR